MIDILEQARETLRTHKMITAGDRVLTALSGGADSVCLLHVLLTLSKQFDFSVCAAHLHHGLRGDEADDDEAFVRSLCASLHVPLFVRHCDIRALAESTGTGLEEAGRHARYTFFQTLLEQEGLDKIATAHHAGDNIETVLMRLIRGTGPAGLAGIPYRNGVVIRPFLDVTRRDIEAYLTQHGLAFRTDSTNSSTDFTRNRIRHQLVPMLERDFNPGFQRNFQEQIRLYADCAAYIEAEAESRLQSLAMPVPGGYGFDCDALLDEPPFLVSTLLHRVIGLLSAERETGMKTVRAVEAILRRRQGQVSLTKSLTAQICHGRLYIRHPSEPVAFCHSVRPEGELIIPETGGVIRFIMVNAVPAHPAADTAYLDADRLAGRQLAVRSRRPGDFFYPVGMTGKKTIKEFFIDNKIPQFLRDSVPLLTADEDIVWVASLRADARYAASKGQNKALCVTYIRGEQIEPIGKGCRKSSINRGADCGEG